MLVKLETRNEQELRRTGARETMIKTYDFLKPRSELRTVRAGNGKDEHRRMIVDHLVRQFKPYTADKSETSCVQRSIRDRRRLDRKDHGCSVGR